MNHSCYRGPTTRVPSGTRSSSYRGPKSNVTFWRSNTFRARNFTNLKSCGFFLTERAFSTAVVSGRNSGNWCEVSRNGSRNRELDSRSRGRTTSRLNRNRTPLRIPLPESCPASSPGAMIAAQHHSGEAGNNGALSSHLAGFPARHFSYQGGQDERSHSCRTPVAGEAYRELDSLRPRCRGADSR